MKQTTLVQIAERLESLARRLPEKIRRPVLRELTPLKQLFLQQRRPRFLFIGSSEMPMQQIIAPPGETKIICLSLGSATRVVQLEEAFDVQPHVRDRLLTVVRITENQ